MVIAEMYFRLKTDSMHHKRHVYSLFEWLGSVGGVERILVDSLLLTFGGYA